MPVESSHVIWTDVSWRVWAVFTQVSYFKWFGAQGRVRRQPFFVVFCGVWALVGNLCGGARGPLLLIQYYCYLILDTRHLNLYFELLTLVPWKLEWPWKKSNQWNITNAFFSRQHNSDAPCAKRSYIEWYASGAHNHHAMRNWAPRKYELHASTK